MNSITGILVDVYNQHIKVHTIEYEDYDEYDHKLNKILKCSVRSGKVVEFGGIPSYCHFDDVGKLRDEREQIPGVLLVNEKTKNVVDYIVGNIFIEKYCDSTTDTISFDCDELQRIINFCRCSVPVIFNDDTVRSCSVLVSQSDWISFYGG